jgi:hypothetical protein
MIANQLWQPRLPVGILLLTLACAGCTGHDDNRPAAPQTAEPAAPAPAPTPAEDRGKGASTEDSAATDQSAFSHVEGGEAERAASKRGHDSAGEPAPGAAPRSGE